MWWCGCPQTSWEFPAASGSSRAHHPVSPNLHTHLSFEHPVIPWHLTGLKPHSSLTAPTCHLRHAHLCTRQPKRTASLSHYMCWHHRSSGLKLDTFPLSVPPLAVSSAPRPSYYLHTRSRPSALTCHTPLWAGLLLCAFLGGLTSGPSPVSLFSCAASTWPRCVVSATVIWPGRRASVPLGRSPGPCSGPRALGSLAPLCLS